MEYISLKSTPMKNNYQLKSLRTKTISSIKLIASLLSVCFFSETNAQNWQALGNGFNYPPRVIYADSVDNFIYAGGTFTLSGNDTMKGIAKWDGTSWSAFPNTITDCRAIHRYNNELVACGTFFPPYTVSNFVKWDGTQWILINNINGGGFSKFKTYNNEVYAFGVFGNVAGLSGTNLVKWDGSNWSTLKDTSFNNAIIDMAMYNGELYIGGTFYNASKNIWNIAKWNGSSWARVGNGGIFGGISGIASMVVYQNELYVAGIFTKSAGNAGNNIQKWNGTQWSDVGGGTLGPFGTNGQIEELKIINNELYAVGVFVTAGGVPAQRIAKWDGINWCGFGSQINNKVGSIIIKNNDIYIAGGFSMIDNDTVNYIAKWIGGSYVDTCGHINVGITEPTNNEEITTYPNPTTSLFTINTQDVKIKQINIYNIIGETIQQIITNNKQQIIDLAEQPNGIYFVEIQTEKTTMRKKVIKQ
jgi:trimeric autotransporter adhesin